MNLKNRDKLLADIVTGLENDVDPKYRLGSIEVFFVVEGSAQGVEHRYEFGLVEALNAVSNDLFWDERGNWSEATRAEVREM